MNITPQQVEKIFLECLSREGEDSSNRVEVEGVVHTVGFNPERLNNHKAEIEALLDEMPDNFKKTGGGGMSFLVAHTDRHGRQWTGEQLQMERLFQLGIGIDKVECLMPRELWYLLPYGMPYYVIN